VSPSPLVVFVGPPAAGKSKLAKKVGAILGCSVVDTDSVIQETFGPIPEIFANKGEGFFREQERLAVVDALRSTGVVALGGGAIINEQTRADLKNHRVALITISAEAVSSRLDNDKRPLLKGGLDAWMALVSERAPWYDQVATATFESSGAPMDNLAEEIASWVKEDAGIR
jgi:shikimate kinase